MLRGSVPAVGMVIGSVTPTPQTSLDTTHYKGKAPPVDPFSGTDPELRLDDWMPALLWASK